MTGVGVGGESVIRIRVGSTCRSYSDAGGDVVPAHLCVARGAY